MKLAGISGIFKFYDFHKGFYEILPFEKDHIKTLYHTRAFDIFKLLLVLLFNIFDKFSKV